MKRINLIFTLIFVFLSVRKCFTIKYHNYTLYRGIPKNDFHLEFFEKLGMLYGANYWREPGLVHRPIEFTIPPEKKVFFKNHAIEAGVPFKTIMEDVQSAFDMQTVKTYIRRNMASFDWTSYYRLDDIYNWLRDLQHMYPQRMQLKSIGKSFKKRDILAAEVRLSNSKNRPKIIVEGGIHAREWISIAFATYLLHQVVISPESNDTILKTTVEKFEWNFVPVLNPDGYEYTHVKDRLYRKNMNGVDLNRNFGIEFGGVGTSPERDSEIYRGKKAFSEPESSAMGNYVRLNSEKLEFYFAFHSYGQYIIIPYAFSEQRLGNYDEVHTMGQTAAKEIKRRYKTLYTVGTAYQTVGYKVSGVSGCWVKKSFNVPYVLTFELRDNGQHGFALPPNQILPTCFETMDGVISILQKQKKLEQPMATKAKARRDKILDRFIIVWNIFLFIIVRY